MRNDLKDAVVVVTGASSGIGRAAACAFARRGANVVLAARREESLEAAADECRREGVEALAVPTDVTGDNELDELARRALQRFGRIDVWVNNAGVSAFGTFEQTPPEIFRRVIETNLLGYAHGCRAALRAFRSNGRGVIINVSSAVGRAAQPYTSAYVASKFAIVGLSECLRQELLHSGIDVCTVLPAAIDTPLFQHAANYTGQAVQPMHPLYSPEMVGDVICRLAESPKREVFAGMGGRVLDLMHHLAPSVAERLVAHEVSKGHFADEWAPPTEGNLYQPIARYARTHGGWSNGRRRRLPQVAATAAVIGLSAVAIGVLASVANGRQTS